MDRTRCLGPSLACLVGIQTKAAEAFQKEKHRFSPLRIVSFLSFVSPASQYQFMLSRYDKNKASKIRRAGLATSMTTVCSLWPTIIKAGTKTTTASKMKYLHNDLS